MRYEPGLRCYYCNAHLTPTVRSPRKRQKGWRFPRTMFTREHIIPKAAGGKGTPENLVASCHGCNTLKGELSAEEFRLILAFRRGEIPGATTRFAGETQNDFA